MFLTKPSSCSPETNMMLYANYVTIKSFFFILEKKSQTKPLIIGPILMFSFMISASVRF